VFEHDRGCSAGGCGGTGGRILTGMAYPGDGPDGPDGPHGHGHEHAAIAVPDDASALEADRLAWLAERRSRERGVRVRPPGTPGELLGRRLPAVTLDGDAGAQPAEGLRPAVVVLVPPGCGCTAVLDLVYRQAQGFRVQTWLVGEAGPGRTAAAARTELVRADEDAAGGGARWAVDPRGDLTAALGPRGLTVALVAADGVLTALHTAVPDDPGLLPALEPAMVRLERP